MGAAIPTWLAELIEAGGGSTALLPKPELAHIHLTSAAIARQVSELTCFFPAPAACAPADDLYIPVGQIVPFDLLLRRHRAVPSQREVITAYWQMNAHAIAPLPVSVRRSLACRVARSWASFVADAHFAALAIEAGYWASYYRGPDPDTKSGTDLLLQDASGNEAAVALYVNTPLGQAFRRRKSRAPVPGVPVFALPLPLDRHHRVGSLHLYTAADVQGLWRRWQGYPWGRAAQLVLF
jgi:hypothetical protein